MKLHSQQLRSFLPELPWSDDELATRLSMIGHEAEVVGEALEVKVFPNRGDILSIRGLSRDLAALYPEIGQWQDVTVTELPEETHFYELDVTESAKEFVWSDHLLKIEGYQPTKSPKHVVELLNAINLQPKDLLIDLTNVVAYEVGMPMHAFAFDAVADGMTIDLSKTDERFTALNGTNHILPAGLLIARDRSGMVVDLVGTMGGQTAAVTPTTTSVLLQAAGFDGQIIRQNSRATSISTEASYRYQRGVDPTLATFALGRFAYLLKQSLPTCRMTGYQALDQVPARQTVTVRPEAISRLLGTDVSQKNVSGLDRLGFSVKTNELTAPSWRFDIKYPADIAEEVARLIGLNTIKPQSLTKQPTKSFGEFEAILGIKHSLSQLGYAETLTYSFTDNGQVKLQNARTVAEGFLRTSLRQGLLKTLSRNPYLPKAMFFEIGAVFNPDEQLMLGLIVSGTKEKQLADIQSKLEELLGCPIKFVSLEPDELDLVDVKQQRVYFAEISYDSIKTQANYEPKNVPLNEFKKISKYPSVVRDLTLVVEDTVSPDDILANLRSHDQLLLAELIDRYISVEKLGENKVALTFRVMLQKNDRSLTDVEASQMLEAIFQKLSDTVKFEIR